MRILYNQYGQSFMPAVDMFCDAKRTSSSKFSFVLGCHSMLKIESLFVI